MKKILWALWSLVQIASIIAVYFLVAALMATVVGRIIPHYDEYRAIYDVQMVWIVWILWDRYYGPNATLLRGVAKTLRAAQKAKQEEDY